MENYADFCQKSVRSATEINARNPDGNVCENKCA